MIFWLVTRRLINVEGQAPVWTGPYTLGHAPHQTLREEEGDRRGDNNQKYRPCYFAQTIDYLLTKRLLIFGGRRKMLSFDFNIPLINFFRLTGLWRRHSIFSEKVPSNPARTILPYRLDKRHRYIR